MNPVDLEEYRFYDEVIERYGAVLRSADDHFSVLVESPGAQGEFESAFFSFVEIASRTGVYIDSETLERVLDYLGTNDLAQFARGLAQAIPSNDHR